MKKSISFALFLIWLGSLSAQSFVGRSNYRVENSPKLMNSQDTLKILAVMVEFQKDNDRNTYGNGKFGSIYSKDYGSGIIDPLPFDANYFSNHLGFAKNYFKKVSNGKLNIVYKVLPQVITVSDSMRNYSPPPQNSSDLSGLGKFSKEVWQLAGAAFPDEAFDKYNLFTIFHAGVGREAPKLSTIENERDLPSVYLGLKSLQSILGNSFNGFPVNGGKFLITNTMILPSTESHEESTFSGITLIKTTINGILVGNIGTYLGLPDLFNSVTGVSAVGRFGLMDGDALFAYSGMFPPEPSAWEKIYLGWETPATISAVHKKINLAARIAALPNDTTILKVPINSTEYFLIENRQRDVNKDGLIITSKEGNQTFIFNIAKDKGKFQWYQVDTLKGVITDVDEPDWAAPGNGIVIWHIDDNIINANIADDKVNTDDKRRGIYVEEADGIFDIGKKIITIAGEDYGRAVQEDMWYAGNQGRYFKNIFSPESKPNTNSNTGANSLITMQNFSVPANKMSFNISFSDSNVYLISSTSLDLVRTRNFLSSTGYSNFNSTFLINNSDLYEFNVYGKKIFSSSKFSEIQPVAGSFENTKYVIGAKGSSLNIYLNDGRNITTKTLILLSNVTALTVDRKTSGRESLLIGTSAGDVYSIKLDSLTTVPDFSSNKYQIYKGDDAIIGFGIDENYYTFLQQKKLVVYSGGQGVARLIASDARKMILTKDASGNYTSVILLSGNMFQTIGAYNSVFQINTNSTINNFAVADLRGDGKNYIVISNGSSVEAYNFEGNLADNFPFTVSSDSYFVGSPLVADINNDKVPEVIGFTNNGNIYAINSVTGKLIDGFPISTGSPIAVTPVIFGARTPYLTPFPSYYTYFNVLDSSNQLYTWYFGVTSGTDYWSGEFGNSSNASFVPASSSAQKVAEFFPMNKAYNWPNPVYGNETKIRYYVNENSDVNIKIFDLAGDLVAELNDKASGGFDNETTWNVSKVQSGIYYARLEVKGNSGATAGKTIKIAVVK